MQQAVVSKLVHPNANHSYAWKDDFEFDWEIEVELDAIELDESYPEPEPPARIAGALLRQTGRPFQLQPLQHRGSAIRQSLALCASQFQFRR